MTVMINSQWQASGRGQAYPVGAERIRNFLCPSLDLTIPEISYQTVNSTVTHGVRNQAEILNAMTRVNDALTDLSVPIFNLGCDCGGEFVPVAKLNEIFGGDLRVIWFDAHPDLNTVETSASHTFHGMVLRALLGHTPKGFDSFLPTPLKPKNVILAGVRSIDTGERDYIENHEITVITPDQLQAGVNSDKLSVLVGGPVYVHVDYDVLDPESHPNTVYQAESGVSLATLVEWLYAIRQSYNAVGYSLTEFSPRSALSDDSDVESILSTGFGLPMRR